MAAQCLQLLHGHPEVDRVMIFLNKKTWRRVDHVRFDLGEDTLSATSQHTSR